MDQRVYHVLDKSSFNAYEINRAGVITIFIAIFIAFLFDCLFSRLGLLVVCATRIIDNFINTLSHF